MIEIKTEALVKPLSENSNLTPLYYEIKNACEDCVDLLYDIYEGKRGAVKDFFAQHDKAYKIIKLAKIDPVLVQEYEKLSNGLEEYEKNIQSILTCVKIGESQEIAIKKLSKMTETVKYFSLVSLSYKDNYFVHKSEEEILKEINDSNGLVRIIGERVFNVKFKNGKVKQFYFTIR